MSLGLDQLQPVQLWRLALCLHHYSLLAAAAAARVGLLSTGSSTEQLCQPRQQPWFHRSSSKPAAVQVGPQ
jgi:hypothetical protein